MAIEELGVQDKIEYDLNAFQIDLDAPKANAAYDHAKAMRK